MRISLLRAQVQPDPECDQGEHDFTYSLFTSEGDWRCGTVQAGRALNTPLLTFTCDEDAPVWSATAHVVSTESTTTPSPRAVAPGEGSYFAVEPTNVILEAVKKAEDSDTLILRLFESAGCNSIARVKLPKPAKSAMTVNMIEDPGDPIEINGDTIIIPMARHEIATIAVTM